MPPFFLYIDFVFRIGYDTVTNYHPDGSNIDWRNKEWLYDHYVVNKLSWPEIGRLVGRTANAVRIAARSLGITSRSTADATIKHEIDVNRIKELYDSGYSIADIAKQFGVVYSIIHNRMVRDGIIRRSIGNGRSTSHTLRNNLLPRNEWANIDWLTEQYKIKSISEIAQDIVWSYTAVHDTFVDLGINIRDTPSSIRLKWSDQDYRNKCLAYSPPGSMIQRKLYKLLDELNIEYFQEGPDTKLCDYYRPLDCIVQPDGVNRSKPLIIEVNGYLHLRNDIMKKDRSKSTYIAKHLPGYDLRYVWDHELWSIDVIEKLCKILNIKLPNIEYDLNELKISAITYSATKEFLQLYHYLGKGRGGKCFGVFLGNKLIACLVFSPPLRQNTAGQFSLANRQVREISRLCVHPIYRRKNLISWFVSRAVKMIDCDIIISYADSTVGHTGACYKASNFKLHHTVPADYWYIDTDNIYMHKKTLYNKARAAKMTEREFANRFGYKKVYGGKKQCFVFNKS